MESGAPEGPEARPEASSTPPSAPRPGPAAWPPPPVPPPFAVPTWPAPSGWPPAPGAVPGWNPFGGAAGAPAAPGSGPGPSVATTGVGRFRPMGIAELVDAALTLYRRNFLLIVAIAAVVHVPFAILSVLLYQLSGAVSALDAAGFRGGFAGLAPTPHGTLTGAQSSALTSLLVDAAIVGAVQLLVVLPISLAAMSRAVGDRYLDRPVTVAGSYAAALRRGGALLGGILLVVLLVVAEIAVGVAVIGLLGVVGPVGVVPAIAAVAVLGVVLAMTAVRSTLLPQAVVIERLGGVAGIRRSWWLTRGAFWRTVAILLLVAVLQTLVGGLLAVPLQLLVSGAGLGTQQLVSQAAGAVGEVLVSPLSLIALTLLYYDLRIRREAFDIEMLAASL
jgi:hypothetical protein